MVLTIDASDPEIVRLVLSEGKERFVHHFASRFDLSEKIIPEIKKFLKKNRIPLQQIKKIQISPAASGFSRIRTPVAIANALTFGLKLKQPLVRAKYDRAPNISKPKRVA